MSRDGFDSWLELGVALGYCSPQFCVTHASWPTVPSEEAAIDDGYDPCVHVVRLGQPTDWEHPDHA